jgi:hypothetical protein
VRSRWPWAFGGAIVLVVAGAVLLTDRCYAEEHLAIILAIGFGGFLVFVFAQKTLRFAALGIALFVCVHYQRSEFTAPTEAGAVSTLRRAAASLRVHKQNHPAEGYPAAIPALAPSCRARGLYELTYTPEKSPASPMADRFTLVAVPTAQETPRSLRSFAIAEDGHLYAANPYEGHPANRGVCLIEAVSIVRLKYWNRRSLAI